MSTGEHAFRLETRDGYGIPSSESSSRFGENYAERIESWDGRITTQRAPS